MNRFSKFLATALLCGALAGCNDSQPTLPTMTPAPAQQGQAQTTVPAGAPLQLAVTAEDMLAANWVLVLDNSASMNTTNCSGRDSRMVAGGKAVINFARQRPANDNFGLVIFSSGAAYARVAAPLGRDRKLFEAEVKKASPDYNTPLGPAIELAYKELVVQYQRQGGYGTYHIVVVTDGDANQGRDPEPVVKEIVGKSPVQVHTVGFCTGERHRLNMPGYATYATADNAEQINQALLAVLASESETFVDSQFGK